MASLSLPIPFLPSAAAAAAAAERHPVPQVPDSKYLSRIPPKLHPPHVCGMTFFGSSNSFPDVAGLAARHDAALVILLRVNHVAHAVSSYRHFNKPVVRRWGPRGAFAEYPGLAAGASLTVEQVPWGAADLARAVEEARQSYARLLQFPARTRRPAHLIFYEDLKRHPEAVWVALQRFLGLDPMVMEGLDMLERRSSDRPAIQYLQGLQGLQAELAGEGWADMLIDPDYDEALNVTDAFAEACRLYPEAEVSWRLHRCAGGQARGLADRR